MLKWEKDEAGNIFTKYFAPNKTLLHLRGTLFLLWDRFLPEGHE